MRSCRTIKKVKGQGHTQHGSSKKGHRISFVHAIYENYKLLINNLKDIAQVNV